MSLFDSLDASNFELFAGKYYNNPQCTSIEEFREDLLRFKYLKKLFTRYNKNPDDLQIRLILNHIIVLYNVFDVESCTAMLFHKVSSSSWPVLVTFISFLNYMPYIPNVDVEEDEYLKNELSKI
jgi:hypothetical protein